MGETWAARDQLLYACEKFAEALAALATSETVKGGIFEAHRCVLPVNPDSVPESIRERVRTLLETRDRVLAPRRLAAMRSTRAVSIAREFFEVASILEQIAP